MEFSTESPDSKLLPWSNASNETSTDVSSPEINTLFPVLFQTTDQYKITVHKYMLPILVSLVAICNIITLVIFGKTKFSNAAHIFLFNICICDMLSCLSLGVIDVYVFNFEDYRDYLPYRICVLYSAVFTFIPVCFHYTSTWLIVGLAIERFICIVYPFQAKRLCSRRNSMIFILLAYLFSMAYLAVQIKVNSFHEIQRESCYIQNKTVSACAIYMSDFAIWYIHPIIYIIIPLIILICIEPAIIRALRNSINLRINSVNATIDATSRRLSRMTLWVVLCFIVSEMPIVIYVFVTFTCLEFGVCSSLYTKTWTIFTHLSLILPILGAFSNFVIYIAVSKHFRTKFIAIFVR